MLFINTFAAVGSILLSTPSEYTPFNAEIYVDSKNAITKQAGISISKVMALLSYLGILTLFYTPTWKRIGYSGPMKFFYDLFWLFFIIRHDLESIWIIFGGFLSFHRSLLTRSLPNYLQILIPTRSNCIPFDAEFHVVPKMHKKASKNFFIKSYGVMKFPRYFDPSSTQIIVFGSEWVKLKTDILFKKQITRQKQTKNT